jgi:L-amino acid N-acyltransferase
LQFIKCTYPDRADAILDIFNEAIVNSTALYDYQPRQPDSMVSWLSGKVRASPLSPPLRTVHESFQLTRLKPYFKLVDLVLVCTCL